MSGFRADTIACGNQLPIGTLQPAQWVQLLTDARPGLRVLKVWTTSADWWTRPDVQGSVRIRESTGGAELVRIIPLRPRGIAWNVRDGAQVTVDVLITYNPAPSPPVGDVAATIAPGLAQERTVHGGTVTTTAPTMTLRLDPDRVDLPPSTITGAMSNYEPSAPRFSTRVRLQFMATAAPGVATVIDDYTGIALPLQVAPDAAYELALDHKIRVVIDGPTQAISWHWRVFE